MLAPPRVSLYIQDKCPLFYPTTSTLNITLFKPPSSQKLFIHLNDLSIGGQLGVKSFGGSKFFVLQVTFRQAWVS